MKTIVKILVFVAIVAMVVFIIRKPDEQRTADSAPALPVKLLDVTPEDIVGLEIVGMRSEYSLSRVSDRFLLSGELEIDHVNQETVQACLDAIAGLSSIEEFSPDVPDDEISLGGYEILKVSTRGNRNYELRISDNPLTNDTRAVMILLHNEFDGRRFRISSNDYHRMLPLRELLMK